MAKLRFIPADVDLNARRQAASRQDHAELPSPRHDRTIADAEQTLDRMDRQLRNLRELLGDGFDGPEGPRAA